MKMLVCFLLLIILFDVTVFEGCSQVLQFGFCRNFETVKYFDLERVSYSDLAGSMLVFKLG